MSFRTNTKDELKSLNIQDGVEYLVEYINKDYFNGEETVERSKAKALINDGQIHFIVIDPVGLEKFISEVRIVQ